MTIDSSGLVADLLRLLGITVYTEQGTSLAYIGGLAFLFAALALLLSLLFRFFVFLRKG